MTKRYYFLLYNLSYKTLPLYQPLNLKIAKTYRNHYLQSLESEERAKVEQHLKLYQKAAKSHRIAKMALVDFYLPEALGLPTSPAQQSRGNHGIWRTI